MTKNSIAQSLDHTLLRAETTHDQIAQLCREAAEHGFASVCVMPYYIGLATHTLSQMDGVSIPVCGTIGFPIGTHQSIVKATEARKAIHDGARELDMVMNLGALKSGHSTVASADIMAVAMVAHEHDVLLKVIIETCLLTDDEKLLACELAATAGADFVKTSTGFSTGGATVQDVAFLRKALPNEVLVKASGGIRDYQTAIAMINAGAARIGTSSGVEIVNAEAASIQM